MRVIPSFGRLPNTWLSIFLIVVSGTVEGIGLALFIPLLHVMGGDNVGQLPEPFSSISNGIEQLGLSADAITLLTLIVVLSLCSLSLVYLQKKVLIRSKGSYIRNSRVRLFSSILFSSWGKSSEKAHGDIINFMTTECLRAGNALGFMLMAVATCVQIVLYLVFSTVVSWQLMLVALGFGGIMYLIVSPLNRRAKIFGERTSVSNRELSFFGLEYLRGLKLLKSTANEQIAEREVSEKIDNVFRVSRDSEINAARLAFLLQSLPILLMAGIIGLAYEVFDIAVPVVLVFLLFMVRIVPRAAQLQQCFHSYNLNSPALHIVDAAIAENEANLDNKNAGHVNFKQIKIHISLEDVVFRYPGSDVPALNSVSMTIGRNQIVAIVGGSGAGKSTVMDILTGLRKKDFGRISVDGVALSEFDQKSWRKKIGMVTQETVTFNTSLTANLKIFNPEATDDDMIRALSVVKLDDFVNLLPEGLNTILGEGGVRFSGGQLQRIALARALVGKPELLLLDEATSALDNESERLVQDSISKLLHTTTIVVIAHRLSTVRLADVIYVMDEGKIIESGTYDALMEQNGRFAQLRKFDFA